MCLYVYMLVLGQKGHSCQKQRYTDTQGERERKREEEREELRSEDAKGKLQPEG